MSLSRMTHNPRHTSDLRCQQNRQWHGDYRRGDKVRNTIKSTPVMKSHPPGQTGKKNLLCRSCLSPGPFQELFLKTPLE